jgi:hypothetical protein
VDEIDSISLPTYAPLRSPSIESVSCLGKISSTSRKKKESMHGWVVVVHVHVRTSAVPYQYVKGREKKLYSSSYAG